MFGGLFATKEKDKKDSDFSKFIRNAPSREKKKVFMEVLEKATEDQKKILNAKITKAA